MLEIKNSSVSVNANSEESYDLLLLGPSLELLSGEGFGEKSVGVFSMVIPLFVYIYFPSAIYHVHTLAWRRGGLMVSALASDRAVLAQFSVFM